MKGYIVMASFNRIIMIGNLTRDPEYKQLTSGQAVCRLGIASNRQFKNRQTGSMVQEVCYVDIDVWGAQAESCRQYLQKGRAVLIEGRLKFDTWEDPQGQTRSKHSIVADRVVFMPAAGATEFAGAERTDAAGTEKNSVDAQLEKELLGQIELIKNRAAQKKNDEQESAPKQEAASKKGAAKKVSKKETEKSSDDASGGEAAFKDEPPFEDELPF